MEESMISYQEQPSQVINEAEQEKIMIKSHEKYQPLLPSEFVSSNAQEEAKEDERRSPEGMESF